MKRNFTFGLLLVLMILSSPLSAQLVCEYTLEMYDSFGDGWNGASLEITVGGTTSNYTVNFNDNNGDFNIVSFVVTDGAPVTINYSSGTFESEVTYFLYDADGQLVFSDGPNPAVGEVFVGTAACPPCSAVPAGSVSIENIRAFTADLSWLPSDPNGSYLIEYGPDGFSPGTGQLITTTGNMRTLSGLAEDTAYDLYITTACANGDTSVTIGPYAFTTRIANDVGVVNITTPASGCGLGTETVTVTLQNFGGLPQSLIPFNYSVNGIPAGVFQPTDGFYTGVLGIDSLDVVEFDLEYDFSEPGEYVIRAWTELASDNILENDTFTLVVNSIPFVNQYPYFENFEVWNGGWSVGDDSNNPSWAYGEPAGTLINAAAGGNGAWVTNLEGNYNSAEFSYLVSPCLDFSGLPEDPVLTFSLFFDSESCCDEAWVEVSTDGGESWTKLGAAGTGANWYNDSFNNWWDGTGGFTGWVYASHLIDGTAGSSDVRVRFVLSTDFSVAREGMGIDNILIHLPVANDLAVSGLDNIGNDNCSNSGDDIVINITNLGTEPATGFDVAYQVNDGDPVVENVGDLEVQPGEATTYTFSTPFNFEDVGNYLLTGWSGLAGDGILLNDTSTLVVEITALNVITYVADFPYYETYEDGPGGWTIDDDSTNPSWAFGQPTAPLISSAASGLNAWVTNLTGNYNGAEFSYLLSPCLDFSAFAEDPSLTFSLFFDSETCCDEGWVEVSTDGGESWSKLGAAGTGVNWYNDASNNWWDGTGGFTGWVYASHVIDGTAGESEVRLRFVLSTDFSVAREGMGIDNVFIGIPPQNDLAAAGVDNASPNACGDPADQVVITITNLGSEPASGFDVAYQLNDEPAVIENVGSLVIQPGEVADYTFQTTFNSTGGGQFTITTWTLYNDDFAVNDTVSTVLAVFQPLPLQEDFEAGVFPSGWTTPDFNPIYGPGAHNTPDFNIGDNLFSGDQSFIVTTDVYGPVPPNYFASFDYRYTNWSAGTVPTVLSPQDSLQMLISTDCGETFTPLITITGLSHLPSATYTNRGIALNDYVGQPVQLQLRAIWASGDYWIDLDNINIESCPASFGFASNVNPESASGAADGSILLGGMPTGGFTFAWDDGATGPIRNGLTAGDYTVTITNGIGCSTVETFTVDLVSAVSEIAGLRSLSLAPNPTNGLSRLRVDFAQSVDARVEVLNLVGQTLLSIRQDGVSRLEYDIDLRGQAAGLYLVRVLVGNGVHTEKLMYSSR